MEHGGFFYCLMLRSFFFDLCLLAYFWIEKDSIYSTLKENTGFWPEPL